MSHKQSIVEALFALQQAVEVAEQALGIHVPDNDDPEEIAESKQRGWDRDYGSKMRPVLLAIEQLKQATAQERT